MPFKPVMESKLSPGVPGPLKEASLNEFRLLTYKVLPGLNKRALFLTLVEVELVLKWFLLEKVNWNGLR